jgi:hypothetical protein
MNFLQNFLLVCAVFLLSTTSVSAQTPIPPPTPAFQYTNEFTTVNEPNVIVGILKDFIQGFDSLLGGFIFYTPDPLNDIISLHNGSEIPGVTKYRSMFNDIAIPIMAIVIAAIALSKIGSDNAEELKSFAFRLIITISLFIVVPSVLSYSIQLNNLLVEKITTTAEFTQFLDTYLDQVNTKIQNGEDSEQYGIPHFDFSLVGGVLKSLGEFIVKIFLFALTFLFLLGGFLYIGFQFVIRFASLLFLGVLYPVIIPFALSERTQHIVYTFFKSWFTFLIMQPAFVLGFAIATDIFTNILNAKGPSVGMLFFYTGFLFFLGGVNILVSRIFGSGLDAMSTNMQAAISSRSVVQPFQSNFRDFRRGLFGGSISSLAGYGSAQKLRQIFNKNSDDSPLEGSGSTKTGNSPESSKPLVSDNGLYRSDRFHAVTTVTPEFSKDLSQRGLQVKTVNQKQGIVSVSGEAYQYNDPKSGLTSLYPSHIEATQDGIPDNKLNRVKLDNAQFIDLSAFNKYNQNPHNYNAMQESRKRGKDLHYAHITSSSHPERVQNFLDVSRSRNDALGVKGVIIKRQGKQSSDHIIRLYSPYEKRQNI